MVNQTILVGRLVRNPELNITDSGKKIMRITLAVPRSFKNVNGAYDTDFVDCILWTGIAECTSEYCKKGDMLAIKGRVQTTIIELTDGVKRKIPEIIAEKVTFLSSKNNNENRNHDKEEIEVTKSFEESEEE